MQNHRWGRMFARSLLAVSAVVCSSLALGDTEKTYDYVSKVQVGEDSFVYFTVPGNTDALVHGTCGNQIWFRSPRPITDDRTKAILSVALASMLSKKGAFVRVSGCADGWYQVKDLMVTSD